MIEVRLLFSYFKYVCFLMLIRVLVGYNVQICIWGLEGFLASWSWEKDVSFDATGHSLV